MRFICTKLGPIVMHIAALAHKAHKRQEQEYDILGQVCSEEAGQSHFSKFRTVCEEKMSKCQYGRRSREMSNHTNHTKGAERVDLPHIMIHFYCLFQRNL